MKTYDPLKPPKPEEWLSLDEQERLEMVESFHRHRRRARPGWVIDRQRRASSAWSKEFTR
jgi:hypothetical protein